MWQEKHNSPSEERGPSRDQGLRKNAPQYKARIVLLLRDNGVFKGSGHQNSNLLLQGIFKSYVSQLTVKVRRESLFL